MREIHNQVKLPISVALEVVLQGVRIRLGRSIVTLMGVVLGIAFLMSILTGQTIKSGVAEEQNLRSELNRMLNFLEAETGPIQDRVLVVVKTCNLSIMEQRFLNVLDQENPTAIRLCTVNNAITSDLPGMKKLDIQENVDISDIVGDASGVLAVGDGPLPELDWITTMGTARQAVLATTRKSHDLQTVKLDRTTVLERELRPEEMRKVEQEAQRQKFRTRWIMIISLLVTVIGVSNAMLMSVTERFREIGTMKCLGALSAFIRQMFFLESCILGFVGSIAGALLGMMFSIIVFMFTYGFGLVMESLNFVSLSGYFGFSLVSGVLLAVIAAIYPASFASKMVPATALRSNI